MNNSVVDVLLVESDPDGARRLLQAFNLTYRVHVVHNGLEALDFLFPAEAPANYDSHHFPKVILLSMDLPKLDEMEMLKRLKADPRTRRIPVIVLTSIEGSASINKCYELGANSCIVKPDDYVQFTMTAYKIAIYWLSINECPAICGPRPTEMEQGNGLRQLRHAGSGNV